jgi:hypothetical protein
MTDGVRGRLVVVGNGMAGIACVEQILKYEPRFDITVFGDETHVNYNRILLSSVLAGENGLLPDVLRLPLLRRTSLLRLVRLLGSVLRLLLRPTLPLLLCLRRPVLLSAFWAILLLLTLLLVVSPLWIDQCKGSREREQ